MNRNQRFRELLRVCLRDTVLRDPVEPDWREWQKCPICHAALGEACTSMSGRLATPRLVPMVRPHGGRLPAPAPARKGLTT